MVDGIQVRLSTSQSQLEYLSHLSSEDVKFIIPLDENPVAPSNDEKTLYSALEGLDELDGGVLPLEDVLSNLDVEEELYPSTIPEVKHANTLVISLVLSAVLMGIVFLLGVCLYALEILQFDSVSKRLMWQIWSQVEKDVEGGNGGVGYQDKPMIVEPEAEEEFDEKVEIIRTIVHSRSGETLFEDAISSSGDDDGADDKFEDAPEGEPVSHSDPDLLPLPPSIPQPGSRSPVRRPLQMREIPSNPPAWSVQASESPSLSAPASPSPSLPHSLALDPIVPPARRRAYRDPIPEFDLALAMQLRPGFGTGADAAWLVRFMMGIFGWFTVLVSGGGNDVNRRLIEA